MAGAGNSGTEVAGTDGATTRTRRARGPAARGASAGAPPALPRVRGVYRGVTITVEPDAGSSVEVQVARHETHRIGEDRDFSSALVAECLDTAVARIRAACGINDAGRAEA